MIKINIIKIIDCIKEDILNTYLETKTKFFYIAYSGGLDSTVVSLLAKDVLGKEKIKLVNVLWGANAYSKSIKAVINASLKLDLQIIFLDGHYEQQFLMKNGPNCNQCTKSIKIKKVKEYCKNNLVITGSNQCDTWGQTGIKLMNGLYSPLGDYDKITINRILEFYNYKIDKIGENKNREGCKLKHLLKLGINKNYHIRSVSVANEILMDVLDYFNFERDVANIKIIGPLSKNIALINVKPNPDNEIKNTIIDKLKKEKTIDKVYWVNKPLKLKITASPGIVNNTKSKYWILKGRLASEFSNEIEAEWSLSNNNKLKTFNVLGFDEIKI